jgi:hypothetical protein
MKRVSDTGSHRHSAPRPPHRRPPPLLVIAATGLAVVLGLGITLLIVRARGDGGRGKDEGTAAALPPEPAPTPQTAVNAPVEPRVPSPEHREPAAPAVAPPSSAAEVPEWERKPLRTSQPFPEEARIDPPMPPIKIPPEMLIPPAAPDAARTP